MVRLRNTVDGENPAPLTIPSILSFVRYNVYLVVQDFLLPQYDSGYIP